MQVEDPVEDSADGTETILLVEDEATLREIARIFLEDYGYHVLEAVDVEESVRTAKNFAGPIHLLLTDVIMPGMSGRQLASQILTVRREMRVVYMSGYTDDMLVHHEVLDPGVALLQKPFNRAQLARKVRSALDAP